jgi:hypothetical protein
MTLIDLIEIRAQREKGINLDAEQTLWLSRCLFLLKRAASIAGYPSFASDVREALEFFERELDDED